MGMRVLAALLILTMGGAGASVARVAPVEKPRQHERTLAVSRLAQSSDLIKAGQARSQFNVTGQGLTVAVIDTGLRASHVDFTGRVVAQHTFVSDSAADDHGHGTNVSGIIAANGDHTGVAPGAGIISLKVLDSEGGGAISDIQAALQWVADNRDAYNISVVNVSVGDAGNYAAPPQTDLATLIQQLRDAGVAVVAAAGNHYNLYQAQGMGCPASVPATVSVGAVFSADIGNFTFGKGGTAYTTRPDRITPFSQRLHESTHGSARTDIFAPGAPVTSSGYLSDHGASTLHGTSQSAPFASGVILLIQELYLRMHGSLPSVDLIEDVLRASGVMVFDGDDEDDNVVNTGQTFRRIDALAALSMIDDGEAPPAPPRGNRPPAVVSEPHATPQPARAGEVLTFSVSASDPDGDQLSYRWIFGDGSEATGHSVEHAYAAGGVYTATVTITDDRATVTASTTVIVESPAAPLYVQKLRIRLNFRLDGRDGCSLKTGLALPAGFTPQGVTAVLEVGEARFVFTLDHKGRGRSALGNMVLKTGKRQGLNVNLRNGSWAGLWAPRGLANEDVQNVTINMPVALTLSGGAFAPTVYAADKSLRYSARAGRGGIAR